MKYPLPALKNDLLLRAINRMPIHRVPVWMMRQAGRTDPLYRKIRQDDGRPLEKLFEDIECAIEISLLPKRLGVDAIIIFQDILTPLAPMGAAFRFQPGPILENPLRTQAQVKALRPLNPSQDVGFVGAIIRGIARKLRQELPILGFAGSPMTLAFFLIAGQSPARDYNTVFRFIEAQPEVYRQLLDVLTTMTTDYLNYQIECGVHGVQLFESFGDVIPRSMYEAFVQPTHEQIFSELNPNVPAILFVKENDCLDLMAKSGAAVLSVGSTVDLAKAQKQIPEPIIFQGNVDHRVLLNGTKAQITAAIQTCYAKTNKQRLILNLNHGLLAETPFEHVQHFVQAAQTFGKIETTQRPISSGQGVLDV